MTVSPSILAAVNVALDRDTLILEQDMSPASQKPITNDQARDTGLALTLLALVITYFKADLSLLIWPILSLILAMTAPQLFKLPAKLWFALSYRLGSLMNQVLLGILFVLVLLPVALLRRLTAADPMQSRAWKANNHSCFQVRNHRFSAADLETPY